jgi:aspartate ammonia-lyase
MANREVCLGYVMNSIGIVTLLNPIIGHHNGDLVGKECARTDKSVREVILEMGLLNAVDLDEIFSAKNLARPTFRGQLFEPQKVVSSDAPEMETHPTAKISVTP